MESEIETSPCVVQSGFDFEHVVQRHQKEHEDQVLWIVDYARSDDSHAAKSPVSSNKPSITIPATRTYSETLEENVPAGHPSSPTPGDSPVTPLAPSPEYFGFERWNQEPVSQPTVSSRFILKGF
jgi:hypothetical protein